jgi:hypothetical protein
VPLIVCLWICQRRIPEKSESDEVICCITVSADHLSGQFVPAQVKQVVTKRVAGEEGHKKAAAACLIKCNRTCVSAAGSSSQQHLPFSLPIAAAAAAAAVPAC